MPNDNQACQEGAQVCEAYLKELKGIECCRLKAQDTAFKARPVCGSKGFQW